MMDSVRRVSLFVLWVALVPASSQSLPVPPGLSGLWSSGFVDSIGSVQGQECSALTISERQIRLSAIPGTNKLEGVWIRTTTNIWMTPGNHNCRWFSEDSTYQPIFQTTWFYVVGAVYDSALGVMKMDGKFANCDGNGCEHFVSATAKMPFHIELKLSGSRLVGSSMTDDPSEDLELIRVDDEVDHTDEAKTALTKYMKLLDSGEFARFYDQATTALFRSFASRQDFIDKLSAQRDRVGTTISRQTKILYVERVPFMSKSSGEYVLFWSGVDSTKSARGLEFILLVNDGGTWKVRWLSYGS
jgi:hypothetical protein